MGSRGRADVDDVDVAPIDQLAPIAYRAVDSIGLRGPFHLVPVASADDPEPRVVAKLAHHGSDRVGVRVSSAHHSVPDDPDPDVAHQRCTSWAAARSAASSAAAASLALAPSRVSPRTWRAKLSACCRSASKKVSSALGGHRNLISSASLVPNTSTLHTSPKGKRRPSETTAVVPPESSASACALSASPGQCSSATPDASDVMGPKSCRTSHRV